MILLRKNYPIMLFLVILFSGLIFLLGGAHLFFLGGSTYYIVSGIVLLLVSYLLWKANPWCLYLYAIYLLITFFWALLEAGLDGWALAPRLILPSIVGVWFSMSWVKSWLYDEKNKTKIFSKGMQALVSVSIFSLLAVVGAAFFVPYSSVLEVIPEKIPYNIISKELIGSEKGEWEAYGKSLAGTRFSPLSELTTSNVENLQAAWTYKAGVFPDDTVISGMSSTPIMVGGTLYSCTQTNVVFALNPETGKEKWRFDPQVNTSGRSVITACRGVAYAEVDDSLDCPKRIITGTYDSRLLAINAETGDICFSFGVRGEVDLTENMVVGDVVPGFFYPSAAPTIVRNKIVVNGFVADNVRVDGVSGVVRAFDLTTGNLSWAWDIGRPGEYGEPKGSDTYTPGTPNSWAPMSGDNELGMVYVPTGNSTPDHWGGHRSELEEEYSSAVVALDAETGEVRWSFQTVHHDLWDYDVASQPSLVDLKIDGKMVPALVQPTKQGQIYLLDRRTGKPLTDIEERTVPHQNPLKDDWLSPTQPFSGLPGFPEGRLEESDMWGLTPFDQLWCRINYRSLNYQGMFTPMTDKGESLVYPSVGGGMNWGGISVDPERGVIVVNAIKLASRIGMLPKTADELMREAKKDDGTTGYATSAPMFGAPYRMYYDTFVSPLNVPCNKPPFGIIAAVDLNSKKVIWKERLGTSRDTGPFGMQFGLPLNIGVPTFGGSIITRGGLVFIAATNERAIRAIDIETGKILWKARLPRAGIATPMTYISPESGRQFVVVSAGGSGLAQAKLGDYLVAFALPE